MFDLLASKSNNNLLCNKTWDGYPNVWGYESVIGIYSSKYNIGEVWKSYPLDTVYIKNIYIYALIILFKKES